MLCRKKQCHFLISNAVIKISCLIILMSETFVPTIGTVINQKESQHDEKEPTKCKPLPLYNDDGKCGRRIASRKCCEYTWQMNHKTEFLEYYECKKMYGIVGGKNASSGEFPHMAAIGWKVKGGVRENRYKFMCGGSLISEKFVLTAAHCTYTVNHRDILASPEPFMVRLGAENISYEAFTSESVDILIKNIIKHPRYQSPKVYYDIALLELFKPQIFTRTIHPACISTLRWPEQYRTANATGWGVTDNRSTTSDILQKATLNLITRNECWDLIKNRVPKRNFMTLETNQLCAGVLSGGVDTCQGDSGGPLQFKLNTTSRSMHVLIGVTTWGSWRCGLENSVGVYTRVSSFLDWIEPIVWPEDYTASKTFAK